MEGWDDWGDYLFRLLFIYSFIYVKFFVNIFCKVFTPLSLFNSRLHYHVIHPHLIIQFKVLFSYHEEEHSVDQFKVCAEIKQKIPFFYFEFTQNSGIGDIYFKK